MNIHEKRKLIETCASFKQEEKIQKYGSSYVIINTPFILYIYEADNYIFLFHEEYLYSYFSVNGQWITRSGEIDNRTSWCIIDLLDYISIADEFEGKDELIEFLIFNIDLLDDQEDM